MSSVNDLNKKWNNLHFYPGGFIRIDGDHPLEIYIGYEEINQKTLLIANSGEIIDLKSSASIIAKNFKRQNGEWAISFRLIRKDNEDVFIHLCWDIIESSRQQTSHSMRYVIDRFLKWQKLMEQQRSDLMDKSRQKGLIGELLYLSERLKVKDALEALKGWVGPEDADQDFIYQDYWSEIKAVSLSTDNVSISSLEQLEIAEPGTLTVFFIDKTAPDNLNGFTLLGKVNELRKELNLNSKANDIFENKVFMYGYTDRREYDEQKYVCAKRSEFTVNKQFPKLLRDNIPSQIISAKYSISLSSIEEFRILEETKNGF